MPVNAAAMPGERRGAFVRNTTGFPASRNRLRQSSTPG
jgi:hypothetical protein